MKCSNFFQCFKKIKLMNLQMIILNFSYNGFSSVVKIVDVYEGIHSQEYSNTEMKLLNINLDVLDMTVQK